MKQIQVDSSVLSKADIKESVLSLLNALPVKGKAGFSHRKGIIESFNGEANGLVTIREDDLDYLLERFNFALENGNLLNYDKWEEIQRVITSTKDYILRQLDQTAESKT